MVASRCLTWLSPFLCSNGSGRSGRGLLPRPGSQGEDGVAQSPRCLTRDVWELRNKPGVF